MTEPPFQIIGLGEVLWDFLPTGKQLGGAPANFAYVANELGDDGIVLSRVGDDELGRDLRGALKSKKLSPDYLQIDVQNETGIVKVKLEDGQPAYEIVEQVAWDFLELSEAWQQLAATADAVCFGSLAQRSRFSRHTILGFVGSTRNDALRIFDVNLRQNFYSPSILRESLRLANVVKLNHEELRRVAAMFATASVNDIEKAKFLREEFALRLVCITRGAGGSWLVAADEVSEFAGCKIEVKDAIGAGDAFTAAMTHGLLRNWEVAEINEFANRVGAFVAASTGAMPNFPEDFPC